MCTASKEAQGTLEHGPLRALWHRELRIDFQPAPFRLWGQGLVSLNAQKNSRRFNGLSVKFLEDLQIDLIAFGRPMPVDFFLCTQIDARRVPSKKIFMPIQDVVMTFA